MNFFEHQDRARRNTRHLILLLIAAVFSLIAITTLLFAVIVYVGQDQHKQSASHWQGIINAFNPSTFLWIALSVSCVVLIGSFFRFVQLLGGGKSVAEAMGGRLLSGNTTNLDERKILNVVEEMAIASGTAVPPVYLLEEDSINAFAAGYQPKDAVIGITRGCIQNLTRDELQGVVAHEFSHVFHGDMRINMRLVSLLYGILVIGLIGEFFIRAANNRNSRRSGKDSPGVLIALGLGLMAIGYAGIFFGNLIKAAVSRQREFLADASAVQFTRNPEGIAGALKKIGGNAYGSQLHHEHAAEFSHMYFGQGVNTFLTLMATHPPLEDRIKRIQPSWNGEFSHSVYKRSTAQATQHDSMSNFAAAAPQVANSVMSASDDALDIEQVLDQLAQPSTKQIDYARARLAEIPETLKSAAHESFSARALVYGLLLDANENIAQRQMLLLNECLAETEFRQLRDLMETSARLVERLRLPLLELCLPALKQLSKEQHKEFLRSLIALINADKRISLMEWALYRIVLHNISRRVAIERSHDLAALQNECAILLSMLAYAGAKTEVDARVAFARAASELGFSKLIFLSKTDVQLSQLDKALEKLNGLKPLQKPQLLKAMSQCVLHDKQVTITEAELFRAIADTLDCPMPPLIMENIH